MMEKVIKELLKVKKIDHPYTKWGEECKNLFYLWKAKGLEVRIIRLQKVAKMLDVTPSFLVKIFQYDKLEEMEK